MSSENLVKLAKIGELTEEPPGQREFDELVRSSRIRLNDARSAANALESRFDLAYNAAHALALAALRWHGFRSGNRYLVFQTLQHTLALETSKVRLLDLCHRRRNLIEYRGKLDIDEKLVAELLAATLEVLSRVESLGPVPTDSRAQP